MFLQANAKETVSVGYDNIPNIGKLPMDGD